MKNLNRTFTKVSYVNDKYAHENMPNIITPKVM